jgi:hypothetical protein
MSLVGADRRESVVGDKEFDVEKNAQSTLDAVVADSSSESQTQPTEKGGILSDGWKQKLLTWGVEVRGITPVPVEERTDTRFINIFSLWFTMSVSLLP